MDRVLDYRGAYLAWLVSESDQSVLVRQMLAGIIGMTKSSGRDCRTLTLTQPGLVEELRRWPPGTVWSTLSAALERGEFDELSWCKRTKAILIVLKKED